MHSFSKCSSCDGLVPQRESTCPHCDAPVPKASRSKIAAALAFVSAGAASMTLMACYGMPPCDYTAADGSTHHDGVSCHSVCVAPGSAADVHCYDIADAGQTISDAGAATTDAGTRDGG